MLIREQDPNNHKGPGTPGQMGGSGDTAHTTDFFVPNIPGREKDGGQ